MRLTLVVPGLLWPRQVLQDTVFDLPLPALATLIGRGHVAHRAARGTAAEVARRLGFALEPLPAAALRLLADGRAAEPDHWLCADPVCLRVTPTALVLDDPADIALDTDEAAALQAALAPLLADLGEFLLLPPRHGYLRLRRPAALHTTAPTEWVGRSALAALPREADWRRLLMEAQMLLHAHPVNAAREAAGRPPVNSLWLWGSGALPTQAPRSPAPLASGDPLLRGLALACGVPPAPTPSRWRDLPPAPGQIAHIGDLQRSFHAHDALAWREALARLEADWFAPLLDDLRRGRLRRLELVAPGEEHAATLSVARRDLWKFWRQPRPLTELLTAPPTGRPEARQPSPPSRGRGTGGRLFP